MEPIDNVILSNYILQIHGPRCCYDLANKLLTLM